MLQVGIVGLGFMGRMHLNCWNRQKDARVVAVFDIDPHIQQKASELIGNIKGQGQPLDLKSIQFYSNYDEFLRSSGIDAVSITTPTWLHADYTIKALEAGIHVLCEKPMALTLEQCDRMIAAADKTQKKLMIAHCIRFWPEYDAARQMIQSGQYGRVRAAQFRRFCSPPGWSSDNWLTNESKSGGMVLDLHIHDSDFIHSLFGLPKAVQTRTLTQNQSVWHIDTQYLYEDNTVITAQGSWLASESYTFGMDFTIFMEKATLIYDCRQTPAFRLFAGRQEPVTPSVQPEDGYFHEIHYFKDWLAGTVDGSRITPFQSRESVRLIEAEKQSAQTGNTIAL
ncbi:Gfo/Idh/MocA family protein [Anaerohalosphaeraceae bacterium U12dextr]